MRLQLRAAALALLCLSAIGAACPTKHAESGPATWPPAFKAGDADASPERPPTKVALPAAPRDVAAKLVAHWAKEEAYDAETYGVEEVEVHTFPIAGGVRTGYLVHGANSFFCGFQDCTWFLYEGTPDGGFRKLGRADANFYAAKVEIASLGEYPVLRVGKYLFTWTGSEYVARKEPK